MRADELEDAEVPDWHRADEAGRGELQRRRAPARAHVTPRHPPDDAAAEDASLGSSGLEHEQRRPVRRRRSLERLLPLVLLSMTCGCVGRK